MDNNHRRGRILEYRKIFRQQSYNIWLFLGWLVFLEGLLYLFQYKQQSVLGQVLNYSFYRIIVFSTLTFILSLVLRKFSHFSYSTDKEKIFIYYKGELHQEFYLSELKAVGIKRRFFSELHLEFGEIKKKIILSGL